MSCLEDLSNDFLLIETRELVERERGFEVELLEHLGEVDSRRLYLGQACSSMFDYCVKVLGFAEGVAYKRIAERKPREDVGANNVRRLPIETSGEGRQEAAKASLPAKEARPANREAAPRPEPLGRSRYAVRFVAEAEVHAQLEELRSLLRHTIPDGDVGKILAKAIDELLERVKKQKTANCKAPRRRPGSSAKKPSRHIPAEVRRTVWQRDGGRCTYRSAEGHRCGQADRIEFHHRVPWARCREHEVDNIALRCRAHNQYEAVLDFGAEKMNRWQRRAL